MTNLGKLKCELQNSRINKWIFSFSEEERVEKGVTYQDLNNFPEKQNYEKIKAISFLVFDDELELVKKLPNYLTKLPNLKNVSLPIDWLNQLDIPDKIVALTLTNST